MHCLYDIRSLAGDWDGGGTGGGEDWEGGGWGGGGDFSQVGKVEKPGGRIRGEREWVRDGRVRVRVGYGCAGLLGHQIQFVRMGRK